MTATATSSVATTSTSSSVQTAELAAVECPECCAELVLAQDPILHEILPCSDCGAELELIAVNPLQVDLAPEVEEDWGE